MNRKRTLPIFALIVIMTLSLVFAGVALANGQETCPEGNGWSSHQDPPLQGIPGATEYCVKGGSSNTQGCQSYLVTGSLEEVQAAIDAGDACGLSHWSYFIPEDEPVCEGPFDDVEINDTGWLPTETPNREVRVITYRHIDPDYPDLDCGEFEEYFYRWTICWQGETIIVPEEDLDQYPGYTPGSCSEEEEDIILVDPSLNCRRGRGGINFTTVSGTLEWKFYVNGTEVNSGSVEIPADGNYTASYPWNIKKNGVQVGIWLRFTPDNTEIDPVVDTANKTLNCQQKPPEEPPVSGGGGGSFLVIGAASVLLVGGAIAILRRQQAI